MATKQSSSRGKKSGAVDKISNMYEAIGVMGAKGSNMIKDVDVDEVMEKAKTYLDDQLTKAKAYAREHPKAVLGALAGVVVGAAGLTAAASVIKKRRAAATKRSAAARKAGKASAASKKSPSSKSSSKSAAKKR